MPQRPARCWPAGSMPRQAERRFSVLVDRELPADAAEATQQAAAGEAASELLALPWELLHDGRGYLFQGGKPVRVRRRQPNRRLTGYGHDGACPSASCWSVRGPKDEHTGYIDHRVSARPLTGGRGEPGRVWPT